MPSRQHINFAFTYKNHWGDEQIYIFGDTYFWEFNKYTDDVLPRYQLPFSPYWIGVPKSPDAGIQWNDNSPDAGIQWNDNSPDAGIQWNDNSSDAGIQWNDNSSDAGIQWNDNSSDAGIQWNDNSSDAGIQWNDNYIYIFKGSKYSKMDPRKRRVIAGYPKDIAPSWIKGVCNSFPK
ncbi:matrix metalloproteinase-14 (membrane-inserted) [Mytilus galloprovincialis]|nr:matrix metalloproteinase-14 (membrane-inserted) [Mytilus galloprovincialis]